MRKKNHAGTLWPCARSKIGPQMGKSLSFLWSEFYIGHFDRQREGSFFCGFLGTQHSLWCGKRKIIRARCGHAPGRKLAPRWAKVFFVIQSEFLYWAFRPPRWGKLVWWLPWNPTKFVMRKEKSYGHTVAMRQAENRTPTWAKIFFLIQTEF